MLLLTYLKLSLLSFLFSFYNYYSNNSNSIPPQLFADALVRIATVDRIKGNDSLVFKEKIGSLLRKIANTDHLRLRELNLCWVNLSHLSPVVVSEAAVKLEALSVINPGLTEEFFQRIPWKGFAFNQLFNLIHQLRPGHKCVIL